MNFKEYMVFNYIKPELSDFQKYCKVCFNHSDSDTSAYIFNLNALFKIDVTLNNMTKYVRWIWEIKEHLQDNHYTTIYKLTYISNCAVYIITPANYQMSKYFSDTIKKEFNLIKHVDFNKMMFSGYENDGIIENRLILNSYI